jgi:hypothetical protein
VLAVVVPIVAPPTVSVTKALAAPVPVSASFEVMLGVVDQLVLVLLAKLSATGVVDPEGAKKPLS